MNVKINTRHREYRRDIDGLRAIAVVCVVIFHAFPRLLPGGFAGVDIFFVISGYLITSHIWADATGGKFSLISFYSRRIKRIYPGLLLVLTFTIVFGWFVLFTFELNGLFRDAASSAIFISNLVFWKTSSYFDVAAESQPLLHLWSLGIEEQFYIIWPLLLVLLASKRRWVFVATFFYLISSFASNIFLIGPHPTAAFYLPFSRFWELLAGALLAIYSSKREFQASGTLWKYDIALKSGLSVFGIIFIFCSLVFITPSSSFPGWWALLPVFGSVCLIAAGAGAVVNRYFLQRQILVYIGLISYPLYLWHWPILVYIRLLSSEHETTLLMGAGVLLSFIFAAATLQFIERPLQRLTKRLSRTGVVSLALFASLALLGLISTQFWYVGIPNNRFLNSEFSLRGDHGFKMSELCRRDHPAPSDFCRYLSDKPNEVLLLGDSHANHLVDGISGRVLAGGLNLVAIGSGNCQPFYDVETYIRAVKKLCPKVFQEALNYAFESPNVKAVVLSSYAIAAISGGFSDDSDDGLWLSESEGSTVSKKSLDVYLDGLKRTLDASVKSKKKLVVVLDNPELDFDPISCMPRPLHFGRLTTCAVDRIKVGARLHGLKFKIKKVAKEYPNVSIVDPEDELCDQSFCYAKMNSAILYIDRNHLSHDGSLLVGSLILNAIFNDKSSP